MATDFDRVDTLFRSSLNKGEYRGLSDYPENVVFCVEHVTKTLEAKENQEEKKSRSKTEKGSGEGDSKVKP